MVFMLWHVFINSEDLASAPSSSNLTNATFLSWFLNVVTRNFKMPRGGSLLLYGNPKGYEVAEHIATTVEVNPRMLSKLKNSKVIWSMNPGANFETSVVRSLGILVALVKRQIGQGYSNSGIFSGRPSMSPFIAICFSLVIETWPKRWWISWEVFFKIPHTFETTISLFLWDWSWRSLVEYNNKNNNHLYYWEFRSWDLHIHAIYILFYVQRYSYALLIS